MTHVLWVPLGVEFDGDIHFVIPVHAGLAMGGKNWFLPVVLTG